MPIGKFLQDQMQNDFWLELLSFITIKHILNLLMSLLILLIGLFVARKVSKGVERLPNLDGQQKMLFRKISYYGLALVVLAASLNQLGFDLKVLLGAAGVLTVAVGFAAQTSGSNLISGFFLMFERPFIAGDVIRVGDITGEVINIDLLSCRIRTIDNLMVRVPNETMVKSNIVNFSAFPIRRIDIKMGVAYKENLNTVRTTLLKVAELNSLCLDEPEPLFQITAFGESSVDFTFCVWTQSALLVDVQTQLYRQIKEAFERANIEIPYPHRVLIQAPTAHA